jgi:hypothetical protein
MSRPQQIIGRYGAYRVIRFRPEHAHRIMERGHDVTDAKNVQHIPGPSITILKADAVVACIGVRILWNGVGDGWVLTSPLVHECPKLFMDMMKRGIDWLRRHGYHRIGANVLQSFSESCRWIERLGFEFEGVAWALGPNGEDYYRYGRVLK